MTNSGDAVRPPLAAYEHLAGMIDFAVLAPNLSEEQVAKACQDARARRVGRLTVRPADLDLVVSWTKGSNVQIGTTVGYPHATETTSVKLYAVRDALQRGARVIETVLNPGKMIARQFRYIESELQQMAQECHRAGAQLVVDFELGWLAEDLRVIACRIAKRTEVDWVRAGSLYGPGRYGDTDLRFLAGKLGEIVKLDAGPSVAGLEDAMNVYRAGATGFQTLDPGPLLETWSAELKRREAERAAAGTPASSGEPG
jgi:deoxyribose-phosphate aldolase